MDKMMIYVENLKLQRTFLELISDFGKFAGYEIDNENHVVFFFIH